MSSRKLTCFYIWLSMFLHSTFSFYVHPKICEKITFKMHTFRNFNSFNFTIWVAVGVVAVHVGLSAVSDGAMVRKVKVTNGMQELRTEEDSLELRQVGSW